METTTRQIVLGQLCNIFTHESFLIHFLDATTPFVSDPKFQIMTCKIVRETESEIMVQQVLNPNEEYGFSDRPDLGKAVIKIKDISLIVYADQQDLKSTPSLALYRKDDKIELLIEDIRNWQVGKMTPTIWRKGTVTGTGMVYPGNGSRHRPYPYIEYTFIRTYWKGDSNGNGEFYDKECTSREYYADRVRFAPDNICKI
jgi:hypothetical protein